jgi:iron complex outermembrane receptor protein
MLNAPIGDTAAIRFASRARTATATSRTSGEGRDYNSFDTQAMRLSGAFEPSATPCAST